MASLPVHLYVTGTLADWEAGYAIAHIRKASWQRTPGRYTVRTVAASSAPVTTMGGIRILASSGYQGAHLYRGAPALTDRGLITASSCFPVEFAAHIFAALDLYEPRVLAAWRGLYTTGDIQHYAVLAAS